MRILHLGDSHLGIDRRCWGGPPGWSRADDMRAALDRALAPAFRGEVDLVLHAGDVFDRSRPPPAAVAALAETLRALGRRLPVVLLAGNHDRRGLRAHLPQAPPGVHLVDRAARLVLRGLPGGPLALAVVPHHRRAADWAAAAAAAVGPGVDLLLTHQAVAGCGVPGFTFSPGRPAETLAAAHLPAGVHTVLSGHIHPHQALRCGAATVVYAGSTARTSTGEGPTPKGTVHWCWEDRLRWRFVPHASRPLVRVARPDELAGLPRGALVRVPPAQIRAWGPALAARGLRLLLPPAAPARGRPRPKPVSGPQLSLFGGPAGPVPPGPSTKNFVDEL